LTDNIINYYREGIIMASRSKMLEDEYMRGRYGDYDGDTAISKAARMEVFGGTAQTHRPVGGTGVDFSQLAFGITRIAGGIMAVAEGIQAVERACPGICEPSRDPILLKR
jgi:hypothetical protein